MISDVDVAFAPFGRLPDFFVGVSLPTPTPPLGYFDRTDGRVAWVKPVELKIRAVSSAVF